MKKMIISAGLFVLLLNPMHAPDKHAALKDIMTLSEAMELDLKDWEIITTDYVSPSKRAKIMQWLETQKVVEGEVSEQEIGFNLSGFGNINIKINIHSLMAEDKVVIVLASEVWDASVEDELNQLMNALERVFFTKNTNLYTCVSYLDSGIMIDGIYTKEIEEILQVMPVYVQTDNVKGSNYEVDYYGYIPSWKTKINVNNNDINFQLAVKSQQDNKNEIIIGTPAILNEY